MAANEPVAIAILAKAPVPGFAKTRLVPALGADGAAALQSRLIANAAEISVAAGIGPVTLWSAPDESHAIFQSTRARLGTTLARQPNGDLGARMLMAIAAANGPALVIGTDCAVLTADHLRLAADVLRAGTDVVVYPAEDGGYVLIGMRRVLPGLFCDMPWSTPEVMPETRRRLHGQDLTWREPGILWDVDTPADLDRLRRIGRQALVSGRR